MDNRSTWSDLIHLFFKHKNKCKRFKKGFSSCDQNYTSSAQLSPALKRPQVFSLSDRLKSPFVFQAMNNNIFHDFLIGNNPTVMIPLVGIVGNKNDLIHLRYTL